MHTHAPKLTRFNLFCLPVTLLTGCWQLVADIELTILMELSLARPAELQIHVCVCVCDWLDCVPAWERIYWSKIRAQEIKRAMSLGCRATWKSENYMLINAYCIRAESEYVCEYGENFVRVFLSMCTWTDTLLLSHCYPCGYNVLSYTLTLMLQ